MNGNLALEEVKKLAEMLPEVNGRPSVYRFWLQHGQTGLVEPLTDDQRAFLEGVVGQTGYEARVKQCYMNAQTLATHDWSGRLHYHEGFIVSRDRPGIALHHAWCSIEGKVVDTTAIAFERRYRKPWDHDYFGVEVDRTLLMRFLLHVKVFAGVTDAPSEFFCEALHIDLENINGKRGTRGSGTPAEVQE